MAKTPEEQNEYDRDRKRAIREVLIMLSNPLACAFTTQRLDAYARVAQYGITVKDLLDTATHSAKNT